MFPCYGILEGPGLDGVLESETSLGLEAMAINLSVPDMAGGPPGPPKGKGHSALGPCAVGASITMFLIWL